MRRIFVSLATLLFALLSFAQDKHPFTFEDMMKLKRVAEPVPSPDGKWVLFAATDVDLAANTKVPHIWIVPLKNEQSNGGGNGHVGTGASPVQAEPGSATVFSTLARILIPDQDGDRPRWSPDGKMFAFISTKEENSAQVWIAHFDDATGTVLDKRSWTSIPTEASGELWAPDGKSIVFTSDVYPECIGAAGPVHNCNVKKLKEAEQSKVRAMVFDHLLYRHWNAYKEGKRTHIFTVPAPSAGWFNSFDYSTPIEADLTPGDFDAPPFSLGGQDNYAFSPDGKEICFTSNHDKDQATSTNNDLWIVPITGGPAKNITAGNPASDSNPLYSPDGKYIAYRAQKRPGYESDRFQLIVYDRKTGEKTNLTENWDRWVGSMVWSPDSKNLYISAENEGQAPIYEIKMAEGWRGTVGTEPYGLVPDFNDDLAILPTSLNLVFTRMTISGPNEIYAAKPNHTACTIDYDVKHMPTGPQYNIPRCEAVKVYPLTHINSPVLSQVAMSPLESFWFTGAHGDKVQGFLVKPPNFDATKKYPLKFLIHGGPQGAWGDDWSYRWNPELFAANGFVVVMINFHGSTGYGQKFIDAINGDWGGAPYEDLMKGLDYAEEHYGFIDKDRECALGASYGGYMVNWILGHTNRFKCLVSHDSQFNTTSTWGSTEELWFQEWEFKGTPHTNRAMYDKWSPHMYAANFKTPTLVVHGQKDYRLDVSEGFQLFTTLQRQGVPSKMLYFPDEGHWVLKPQNSQLWYKTVNDWVDQWLKE